MLELLSVFRQCQPKTKSSVCIIASRNLDVNVHEACVSVAFSTKSPENPRKNPASGVDNMNSIVSWWRVSTGKTRARKPVGGKPSLEGGGRCDPYLY